MIKHLEESFILELQKFNFLKFLLSIFTRIIDYDVCPFIIIFLFFFQIINIYDLGVLIIGIGILFLLKLKVKRVRPFRSNQIIKKLNCRNVDKNSFPSGHTFISELLVLIILKNYPFLFLGGMIFSYSSILLTLSKFVGLSRIYLGDHYPTDVLFSIIFFILFLLFFY